MKIWISVFTLLGVTSQIALAADLTAACQQSLQDKAVQTEKSFLTSKKQILAGDLQPTINVNKETVYVHLTDDVDGRSVVYKALLTESNKASCEIKLQRDSETACRYSAYEGEDNLAGIPGFILDQNKVITGDSDATKLEAAQITKMLASSKEDGMSLKQLIESTSDQEILKYEITTPENKKLVYYKYYAAETAVGTFYKSRSVKPLGENNDGEICIKY